MVIVIGVVVLGLVAANVYLLRELTRLRRRTRRLAVLSRNEARRVRSMDWATAQAFAHVQSLLADAPPAPEPAAGSQKPTLLN
jgi:hypothetical protein